MSFKYINVKSASNTPDWLEALLKFSRTYMKYLKAPDANIFEKLSCELSREKFKNNFKLLDTGVKKAQTSGKSVLGKNFSFYKTNSMKISKSKSRLTLVAC